MHGPEVQYLDRNSDLLPPDPRRSIDQELDVDGEIQLITSPWSLRRVVVDLKLDDRPKFQRGAGTGILSSLRGLFGGDPDSASSTEIAAGTLQRHLKAERLGRSAVISIGYTAGDPALSAEIANAIARNIAVDDVFLSQLTMTERAGFELLKTWIVSPATAPLVPSSPDMQITDRALANQRAQQAYAERVAFDVQYVAKRSIWLDLSILLKTAKVLVLQDGK
jgi:uncharacterized protein involved in exopolysaccharide biosynthesis